MPYSDPTFDKKIKSFLRKKQFFHYLDIGAGAGKYGKIIREINPKATITAIEPDKSYIKRFKLSKIYNKIVTRKVEDYLLKMPNFTTDVCIIGDCIEHLKKSDGIDLINYLCYRTNYIIVVFPSKFLQYSYEHHDLEAHISVWGEEDFKGLDFDYEKKGFMNIVIIKGFLGDPNAIGTNKLNVISYIAAKLFGKEIKNKAFT